MVLIFLADCQKWLDAYEIADADYRKPDLGDLILACEDALIAAQSSVIAAESLGIGSCYIGDILEYFERTSKLLSLEKYVFPISMIVYGYPTKQQKEREKPKRFDKRFMVLKNEYSRFGKEEIVKMFETRNNEPHYDFTTYIKAFC